MIAATNALIRYWIFSLIPKLRDIFIETIALNAPLNTPQISPTTSAHIFATFAEFFIKTNDFLDPSTFLVAFAWNSFSSATVTATPIISNIIPTSITKNKINIAKPTDNLETPFADIYEKNKDNIKAKANTCIAHLLLELSLFFESYLSFILNFFSLIYIV